MRSRVNNLRVHTGRFSGIPFEDRVCEHCSDWEGHEQVAGCVREPEDEEHLVMRCDKYRAERKDMYADLGWAPTGHAEGDEVVFGWLIGGGTAGGGQDGRSEEVRGGDAVSAQGVGREGHGNDSECEWAPAGYDR